MKKYLLLLFTLMFAVSCSDDSSSSTPAPDNQTTGEIELIQKFNYDSYPADLSPFAPIPNNPNDTTKVIGIKYGIKKSGNKEYPNAKFEFALKNGGDINSKLNYTYCLDGTTDLPLVFYPCITLKVKSTDIEQIPLILTLKSGETEVKKWEITINSIFALQPTERIVNTDGTIQYNNISTDIKFEKANDTKRIYFFNSTSSPLKIDSANWMPDTNHFRLKYDNQKDEEGYSNCYKNETTPNYIPSSSACFIDVEYVGGSSDGTTDTLTVTPKIRDVADTNNIYKPTSLSFKHQLITIGGN